MAAGQVRDRVFGLQHSLYAGSVCDDSAAAEAYAAIVALDEPYLFTVYSPGGTSSQTE